MSAFHRSFGTDGGVQECGKRDRTHLDTGVQTPSEELFCWLEEVDMDTFGQAEDETLKELLEALPADESDDDFDVEASLAAFHEKHKDQFDQPKTAKSAPRHFQFSRIFPFVAVFVVAVGVLISANAASTGVFDTLAKWTSEVFHFVDSSIPYAEIETNPLAEGETRKFDTLQKALDAFGIDELLAPTWVPDRFAIPEVEASYTPGGISINSVYSDGDCYLRISFYEVDNINYGELEKDLETAENVYLSKIHHYIVTDYELVKAVWWNGELECHISGNLSSQEMKEVIKSIYKVVT